MPNPALAEQILPAQDLGPAFAKALEGKRPSGVCLLVDQNTARDCLPLVRPFFPTATVIEVAPGEENKTLETCARIWSALTAASLDRHAILINLGGGVIGDMGGFCASTYKRGIRFIQVPTTLLSQVDASVGGKLGVDFEAEGTTLKNHIGVFQEPEAVIIHPTFLKTLADREIKSGFAEMLKHALIADAAQWGYLTTQPFGDWDWMEVITHSVAIKEKIVTADPTEKGLRKLLNFGHTIGHAIESYLLNTNRRLLHGEAIALGMIAEANLSVELGLLDASEAVEIRTQLERVYGAFQLTQTDIDALLPLALQDKKNQDGQVLCTLLDSIGKGSYNHPVSLAQMGIALQKAVGL